MYHLKRGSYLPEFIQEDGAVVRSFPFSFLLRDSSSERPPLMTEKLAFQQALCQRRAIDSDKRLARSRTVRVDSASDQFLAGSAFTADQNCRIRRRDPGYKLIHRPHLRTLADHTVFDVDVGLQPAVFVLQPFHLPG